VVAYVLQTDIKERRLEAVVDQLLLLLRGVAEEEVVVVDNVLELVTNRQKGTKARGGGRSSPPRS